MGIIKYENKIKTFGSDLGKSYAFGATELNKLKFKPNMGDNHPGDPPRLVPAIIESSLFNCIDPF